MSLAIRIEGDQESNLTYLDRCGEAGRALSLKIREVETSSAFRAVEEALKLVRARRLDPAFELFDQIEARAKAYATEHPAISWWLGRHLHAARAYGHYMRNDLEAARVDLRLAYESLRALVSAQSFLSPLAMGFTDFLIQRARLARRENRWKEAQTCLDELRGIYQGAVALCTLDSGLPLWIGDIRRLGQTLDLTEEQRLWFKRLIGDTTSIEELVDSIEMTVFTLPDQVIPYYAS